MAKIEFTGFVDPWSATEDQHPKWGMKVVELHSRKNEKTNEWETVGRTWRTVRAAYGTEIDFTQFKKGDRVEVTGVEVTLASESNGKKYYNLTVNASTVTLESGMAKGPEWQAAASAPSTPATTEAPF
jgi:hypothetical protein